MKGCVIFLLLMGLSCTYGAQDSVELNRQVIYVQNPDSLLTIADLPKFAPNKLLYIDVWATWCGPCKVEFNTESKLADQFIRDNDIVRLYISIDRSWKQELWRKIIEENKLNGIHFIAPDHLVKNFSDLLFERENITVPTYLIINSSGEILESRAHAPSSGQKLIDQFKKHLENR